MGDVPIAFLIMAHADPVMLNRLVRRMYDPASTYVIHINRRSDITPFVTAFADLPNVHFVPDTDRVAVNWAGFSFTEGVFAAVRHALRVSPNTQRFVLMSGADYPIKPLPIILAEIRKDQEILTVSRKLDRSGPGFHNNLARRYYLGDRQEFNVRTASWILKSIGLAINKYGPIRKPYPLQLYHGTSWWSLTRVTIDHILSLWGTPYTEWFRYAQLADEVMVHTLLMDSDRAPYIKYNQLQGIGELDYYQGINGPHYADWRNPNPTLPRHLGIENYDEVISSEPLFMRKVDSVHSKPLLDRVDSYLDSL